MDSAKTADKSMLPTAILFVEQHTAGFATVLFGEEALPLWPNPAGIDVAEPGFAIRSDFGFDAATRETTVNDGGGVNWD